MSRLRKSFRSNWRLMLALLAAATLAGLIAHAPREAGEGGCRLGTEAWQLKRPFVP